MATCGSRTVGEFLFGVDYGFAYIPSDKEIYAVFTKKIKEGFCGSLDLALKGQGQDDIWDAFVGWCIKHLDETNDKLRKFRYMRLKRKFYSRSLPVRIALKAFCSEFGGLSI